MDVAAQIDNLEQNAATLKNQVSLTKPDALIEASHIDLDSPQ